jgi:transcriptional regulator with XRE-family HTH domain
MAETMGDRIRMQRARLRMSQGELAKRIGISLTSMSAIEAGHTDPRASRIIGIAAALGVSADYLLGIRDSAGRPAPSPSTAKPPALRTRPRKTAPVG